MTDSNTDHKPRLTDISHVHVYGPQWYPYNRMEIWRQCVLPGCNHTQVKKA